MKILIILLIIPLSIINSQNEITNRVSYAESVKKAAPAVVSIQTIQEIPLENHPMIDDPLFKFFFGEPGLKDEEYTPHQKYMQHGLGSGVIINDKGYILTNNHVIKDAASIEIKFSNGITSEAEIIGSDLKTDLAVLKTKETIKGKKFPVIEIGNSDTLKVGDVVLAIGNPFGFDNTVTQGIVSALGSVSARSSEQHLSLGGLLDNLIQTDAAINPGNSGGALVDIYGNLVGINIAIITRSGGYQGIGFAIPINLAKDVMEELINKGRISRPWIGIQLNEIPDSVRISLGYDDDFGIYIQTVLSDSPASDAGLISGDIIRKINDEKIKSINDAIKIINTLIPGKIYQIEIFRKYQIITCTIIMGQTPKEY